MVHTIYFDRFTHYDIDDWVSYAPATSINSIDIGDDYVYFATNQGGILRYHLYDDYWDYPYTTSNGLRSNRVYQVIFNPDDHRIYARTSEGLDVYDRGFDYWRPALPQELTNSRQPDPVEVQNFGQQGNYRFPAYYRPSISELPNFFTDIEYMYRPEGDILDPYNRVFKITSAIVDPWYRLWIGTDGLGVGLGDLNTISLSIIRRSLPNISPRDLLFDGDRIWIGGFSRRRPPSGITCWNTKEDTWTYFEAQYDFTIYNDNVYVIEKLDDHICFGTELGLATFDTRKKKWRSFTIAHGLESNRIYDLLATGNRMFIATEEGLNWYDPSSQTIGESGETHLDNVPVYKLMAPDSSGLLLATRNGLYRYDIRHDQFSFYTASSALMDLRITAARIQNDSLWIANEYGIAVNNMKTDIWQSFTQVMSPLMGRVKDIAFAGSCVWFATDGGLLKYDKKRDYWYLYTTEDGLLDNHVYKIDPWGDDLWISTAQGICLFRWYHPDRRE